MGCTRGAVFELTQLHVFGVHEIAIRRALELSNFVLEM